MKKIIYQINKNPSVYALKFAVLFVNAQEKNFPWWIK